MLNAFTQLPHWPLITIFDYFDPHFKMEAFEVSGSSESHILLILWLYLQEAASPLAGQGKPPPALSRACLSLFDCYLCVTQDSG